MSIYHQSNVLIGKYCGNLMYNLAVMVAGNYTVIKFHSENARKGRRGFRLHFIELPRSGKCRRDLSVIQEFVWEIILNFQSNLLASTGPSIFLDRSGQYLRWRPAVIFYVSHLSGYTLINFLRKLAALTSSFAWELKQQQRRRLRKRYIKSEFALLQTLSRLFISFNSSNNFKSWQFFLALNSKRLYRSSEKEERKSLPCVHILHKT